MMISTHHLTVRLNYMSASILIGWNTSGYSSCNKSFVQSNCYCFTSSTYCFPQRLANVPPIFRCSWTKIYFVSLCVFSSARPSLPDRRCRPVWVASRVALIYTSSRWVTSDIADEWKKLEISCSTPICARILYTVGASAEVGFQYGFLEWYGNAAQLSFYVSLTHHGVRASLLKKPVILHIFARDVLYLGTS